jgi:hypothetical protein
MAQASRSSTLGGGTSGRYALSGENRCGSRGTGDELVAKLDKLTSGFRAFFERARDGDREVARL